MLYVVILIWDFEHEQETKTTAEEWRTVCQVDKEAIALASFGQLDLELEPFGKMTPSDWTIGKTDEHFLDEWLKREVLTHC